MDVLTHLLLDYGYWGMLVAAFLAGSFFPFSSEAIMLALLAAGSMFNYGVGRMGRIDWIERYLHVKKRDLDKAQRFLNGHGAWMAFFAFLPILGSAITIVLGLMRANIPITFTSITLGKALRYILIAYSVGWIL